MMLSLFQQNADEFNTEVNKYNNATRMTKISKIMSSFEKSIEMFSYKIEEIVNELSGLYDFAIRYYSRYILHIVNRHQNDQSPSKKKLIEDTYNFLLIYVTDKKMTELLYNDYIKYTNNGTNDKISEKKINANLISLDLQNYSQSVNTFFANFSSVFQTEYTINLIIDKTYTDTVVEYIESHNMQHLLDFAYEVGLMELFIFIYAFYDVYFNYANMLYNKCVSDSNSVTNISSTLCKVKSSSSIGRSDTSIHIAESRGKMSLINEILYMKRYSRLIMKGENNMKHIFVKKYGDRIKYFSGINYSAIYAKIHENDPNH